MVPPCFRAPSVKWDSVYCPFNPTGIRYRKVEVRLVHPVCMHATHLPEKVFHGIGDPTTAKGKSVNFLESLSSPRLLSLVLEGGTKTMAAQILYLYVGFFFI